MSDAVIEQPGTELQDDIPPQQDAAPLSIADHAKAFGPGAQKEQPAAATEPAQPDPPKPHHSAEQKRDRDNGQWREGRQRHRAQSQQARPEDVPRIRELTGKNRDLEAQLVQANTELARLRQQHAPPAQIQRAEAKADRAQQAVSDDDPEPREDDAAFGGDYGKYLQAHTRWAVRDENRKLRESESQRSAAEQWQQADHQRLGTFRERVTAARQKHQDYDAVVFSVPSGIPEGSPMDAFVMDDDSGPELLYYFATHPEERDSLLAMPTLGQLKALSLLSQRLLSPPSVQAGTTGAAAGRQTIVLPSRPATPVRTTGSQRASDGPPPTDGTLGVTGHAKAFHRR